MIYTDIKINTLKIVSHNQQGEQIITSEKGNSKNKYTY